MAKKQRYYITPDGEKYQLFEAAYDTAFTVFKSDMRKAVIGDPTHCIEALGLLRDPDILHAYIGSGKDAYVVYKGRGKNKPSFACHFTIPTKSSRVRDLFDQEGAPKTQVLWLRKPTASRTLAARAILNKRRNAEIKNGTGKPIAHRGSPHKTRIEKLGVPNRPPAHIVRDGNVDTSTVAT